MVSDSELVSRLQEILRGSDLDTTTPSGVRRQLEDFFAVDLSDRKSFIRDQIDVFLESQQKDAAAEPEPDEPNDDDDGDGGVENDDSDGEGTSRSNKEGKVRKRGGFNKLCSLSPKLQELLGETEMSRPEVVKGIWSYIREKDLQDPKNRRNILCDEPMRAVFRVNSINMFQMNKVLSKHIWPLNAEDETVKQKMMDEESDPSESEVEASKRVKEEEVEDADDGGKDRTPRRRKRKGGSAKVEKEGKKRGGGGFAKVCSLSPQLQTFTGEAQLARTEVVKRLWVYIKENKLQDPGNKQNIICDEPFRSLFNVDRINMFQMNKVLSKHIWPLNASDVTVNSSQQEKQPKLQVKGEEEEEEEEEVEVKVEEEEEEELRKYIIQYLDSNVTGIQPHSDEPKQEEKKPKKGSAFLTPLPLSDALVKFIGTGENALPRGDVVKRMWEYIKKNELQDPSDKRRIMCDDKLRELFDVDSFNGFSVTKLLSTHFLKEK